MDARSIVGVVACFAVGRCGGSAIGLSEATGPSMQPTLFSGDWLLVVPFGGVLHRLGAAASGADVSALQGRVVTASLGPGVAICKRVTEVQRSAGESTTAWLLGDNPGSSQDSRDYGAGTRVIAARCCPRDRVAAQACNVAVTAPPVRFFCRCDLF